MREGVSAKRRVAGDGGKGRRPSAATVSLTRAGLELSDAGRGSPVPGRSFSAAGRLVVTAVF